MLRWRLHLHVTCKYRVNASHAVFPPQKYARRGQFASGLGAAPPHKKWMILKVPHQRVTVFNDSSIGLLRTSETVWILEPVYPLVSAALVHACNIYTSWVKCFGAASRPARKPAVLSHKQLKAPCWTFLNPMAGREQCHSLTHKQQLTPESQINL